MEVVEDEDEDADESKGNPHRTQSLASLLCSPFPHFLQNSSKFSISMTMGGGGKGKLVVDPAVSTSPWTNPRVIRN